MVELQLPEQVVHNQIVIQEQQDPAAPESQIHLLEVPWDNFPAEHIMLLEEAVVVHIHQTLYLAQLE